MSIKIKNRTIVPDFFILVFLLLCVCCKGNIENRDAEFYDFGNEGMAQNLEYVFTPFKDSLILKANEEYKLEISVRYSSLCTLKKLPLHIEYSSLEHDVIHHKDVDIALFDDADNINGKGNFNIFETKFPLINNQKPEEGYFIAVSTPEKSSKGVVSLGIVTYPETTYETNSR